MPSHDEYHNKHRYPQYIAPSSARDSTHLTIHPCLRFFVLLGIGQMQFDGHFIALHLLMIAAFRIVSYIGIQHYVVRILRTALHKVRRTAPVEQAA